MAGPAHPVRLAACALVGALSACSEPATLSLVVTPGYEEDAFSRAPAVTSLEIVASSPDGEIQRTATTSPGGSFDLGEIPSTQYLDFELRGLDAEGQLVARGRSVTVPIGAIDTGDGVELPLFLQRLGETARPPGALAVAHLRAPAAIFGERYVLLSGGERALDASGAETDPASSAFYDLLAWGGAAGGTLPRRPASLVVRGSAVLSIDASGATWVDLSTGTTSEAVAPTGLDFAQVAGGRTIDGLAGLSFVVGATRDGEPTSAVLVVDDAGTLRAASLGTARSAAGATFVAGRGLVVTGGSALGAGAELVASDGTGTQPLPFASDPTTGAAAISLSGGGVVLLAGGRVGGLAAPTRSLDLDCVASCAATELGELAVPALAARGLGYDADTTVLLTGESPEGETLLFELEPATPLVRPLPLRERRRGATAAPAPNGTLLVVGGELLEGGPALRVESVFPR
jgi:hypothetical protein